VALAVPTRDPHLTTSAAGVPCHDAANSGLATRVPVSSGSRLVSPLCGASSSVTRNW